MEAYDGMTILATNLQKTWTKPSCAGCISPWNFPSPARPTGGASGPDLARRHASPVLDLDFMAQRFEVTGGAIRNIALSAAFLAADDGDAVQMRHLLHATQRSTRRWAKSWSMANSTPTFTRYTIATYSLSKDAYPSQI
ncbi:MAG: hypothetical protein R2856_02190 [Caldilineaceae bacterium]